MIFIPLAEKQEIEMIPFRIAGCTFGNSFSNAQLVFEHFLVDRERNAISPSIVPEKDFRSGKVGTFGVSFDSLFSMGFHALRAHLNDEFDVDPELVSDPLQNRLRHACGTLFNFLCNSDYHGRCLATLDDAYVRNVLGTETLISALLSNHLLSRLAQDQVGGYFISNDSRNKVKICPCDDDDCKDPILYGGSGFGSTYLWYGQPDIILFPVQAGSSLSVVVPSFGKHNYLASNQEEDDEAEMAEGKIDSSPLRDLKNVRQIVAQTITFSFYQHKYQGMKSDYSKTHLTPTVAVCADSFDVYMYDVTNDILLRNEGDPIEFRNGEKLCISSVVNLWMLVNHLFVRPSLDGKVLDLLKGSCGLQKCVNEQYLNKIDQTMEMRQSFVSQVRRKTLPKFNQIEL